MGTACHTWCVRARGLPVTTTHGMLLLRVSDVVLDRLLRCIDHDYMPLLLLLLLQVSGEREFFFHISSLRKSHPKTDAAR